MIKLATWNISAGINTNDYQGEFFDKSKELKTDDRCLNDIARIIKEENIDIIALQEFFTTESFKYMQNLSEKTGLKYYESFENSPCHLIENANFGVAILSRYPISVIKRQFFENPRLTKQTAKGLYHTHDKGYLAVNVKTEKPFNMLCASLLPLHRFDHNIVDFKHIFDEFQDFALENQVFALGDFNAIKGKPNLQQVFDRIDKEYEFLFDEVTTIDNKKCDNILLPRFVKVKNKYLLTNEDISDHFLCVAEIDN